MNETAPILSTVPLRATHCSLCGNPLIPGPNLVPMGDGGAIHGVCPARRNWQG